MRKNFKAICSQTICLAVCCLVVYLAFASTSCAQSQTRAQGQTPRDSSKEPSPVVSASPFSSHWQAGQVLTQAKVDSMGIACCFRADTIDDMLFSRISGKSFPANCSVDRGELRYLRLLHRNALGQIVTGEMICHQSIADDLLSIFRQLYDAAYPIERMVLIDDYDADDERSMTANNSSSFCFRTVAGSTKLSKHARGLAVDINTLYNPCVRLRRNGSPSISPAAGRRYADRRISSPYKIVEGDLCHRLFLQHGFIWGGSWNTVKDYQHFEK